MLTLSLFIELFQQLSIIEDIFSLQLAVSRGDKIRCFVDGNGNYSRQLGHTLDGKSVLGDGQEAALQMLKKDVIYTHPYKHSYPYDWRTKKVNSFQI